jgi:hypothetical protein
MLEPRPASAAEPGNGVVGRLVYTRSGSAAVCPEERTVHDLFLAQLGRDVLTDEGSARLLLTVTSRPGSSDDLEGHLELLDTEGQRVWANDLRASHDDCETLIGSLALSFRVAQGALLDAKDPRGQKPRPEEPIVVDGAPEGASTESNALAPRPTVGYVPARPLEIPISSDSFSYELWGNAAALIGATPGAATRVALDLGLSWSHWSLFFEPRVVLPWEGTVDSFMVRITRFDGAFVPCYRYGLVFGCAIVATGGIWVEAQGSANDIYADVQVTAGVRAGLNLTLDSRVGGLAFADVEANVLRIEPKLFGSSWAEPVVQVALGFAFTWAYPRVQQ